MLNKASSHQAIDPFESDVLDWFSGKRHGHMGKWQYIGAKFEGDPCRGDELWDIWENLSGPGNMLNRQKTIINNYAKNMAAISGPKSTIIDLGPGGERSVINNTLPFIEAYTTSLKNYIAIDLNYNFCADAIKIVKARNINTNCIDLCKDFLRSDLFLPYAQDAAVLFCGGTIGNFEAEQNTPHAVERMVGQLIRLRRNMPEGSVVFVGLEATQDPEMLYGDYDHPAHAEYEINVMYAIKRDLIPNEEGFQPGAWRYVMKWWPDAHQFCHIAEATERQRFKINGQDIVFEKGTQLVVDNSFKFPSLSMRRAAQLAKVEYLRPFMDDEGRMAVHVFQF